MNNLPTVQVPTFKVTLPSTGETITLKSLTSKEYKLLLLAKEGDGEDVFNTIIQLINNCDFTNKLNVSKLPWYDIEFLFVRLIGTSTGQRYLKSNYRCQNNVGDEVCGNLIPTSFDLQKVEINKENIIGEHKVVLTDESGSEIILLFKLPTAEDIMESIKDDEDQLKIIASCLNAIGYKDNMMKKGTDYDINGAYQMLENVDVDTLKEIGDWLGAMPTIESTNEYECNKCGFKHELKLRGLNDFFMLPR